MLRGSYKKMNKELESQESSGNAPFYLLKTMGQKTSETKELVNMILRTPQKSVSINVFIDAAF